MPNNKPTPDDLRHFDAENRKFKDGFQRSRKGNLWQVWEGQTVTVFRRDDETYGWVVAGSREPLYSKISYASEREALSGLAFQLQVGRE